MRLRAATFSRPTTVHAFIASYMRILGRILQVAALIGLPLAIPLELAGAIRTGPMLTLMVASIALFYIGRLLEGYATG